MLHAYTNASVFTGTAFIQDHAVIVLDNKIVSVLSTADLPTDIGTTDCRQHLLVPAFIDLQIYGAGGQLFSAHPTSESLQILAAHNAQSGTASCLVTIATQPIETIDACIAAVKNYWEQRGEGIMGMHLEGPFINAAKRGAHVQEWVQSPSLQQIQHLLRTADGAIKMVTLAPECVDDNIIECFIKHGVVISAGHSDASFVQAEKALNNGVSTITHLYNAMSPLHHREPGLVGAVMQHSSAMASIIPDGIHVHYEAVKIAKKAMGERLFFITDAVTETAVGPYQHVLDIDHYNLPNGTLSGSALTMIQAVHNAVTHCNIDVSEALRMASLYPARAMGIQDCFGKIEPGFNASLALLHSDLSAATVLM